MARVEVIESNDFIATWRPNRSLTAEGRWLWLGMLASTVFLLAGAAAALGGWLVLPFAGMEVLLVAAAFHFIGRHDGDYETLSMSAHEVNWVRLDGRRLRRFSGNPAWMRYRSEVRDGRLHVSLCYAGQAVVLGAWLSETERHALTRELGRRLRGGR
jgi:uncharacterized membrane protein